MCEDPGVDRILTRIEALAAVVRRRALLWGWGSLVVGGVGWVAGVWQPWDAHRDPSTWWPLAVGMILPGLIVLGFARRIGRLHGTAARVGDRIESVSTEARRVHGEVRRGGLRALLTELYRSRDEGEEVRAALAEAIGTARLLNPAYLGLVGLAAAGAGMVVGAGLVVIVIGVM